jgi:hypothetical protein
MMNPSKVAVSLLFLTISLLLLSGCEGMMPTENNPPAVVPNLQPGAPIAGGLRIVSVHASPLNPDMMSWKPGTVNVRFNGAATMPGVVEVSAREPGWQLYSRVGTAKFFPGQTDVQVPIKVLIRPNDEPAEVPLKVSIQGSSAEFQTRTHYSGNR